MEQKRTLGSWISARRYIRDFAADYAARHGENAAEIEKDILQAKKRNHISLNEYEWVGYHDRTEAQKRTMSTLWTRAEFRKNFTDRRYIAILMNKYIFSKVFSDFYGRRCVQASAVDAALLRARRSLRRAALLQHLQCPGDPHHYGKPRVCKASAQALSSGLQPAL